MTGAGTPEGPAPADPRAPSGDPAWSSPTRVPVLAPDEAHVWLAERGALGPCLARLEANLEEGERGRAGRFRFERDRVAFVLGRGLLRLLLGRYVGARPEDIRFALSERGKPFLEARRGVPALEFNLSHSGELVLIAVGLERCVGVDVERIYRDASVEQIAERFFSPREVAALRGLAPALRREAFYACWTRKEAYIKARGEGIFSLPLGSFSVVLAPGVSASLLEGPGTAAWWLEDVPTAPGYAGAVAGNGRIPRFQRLRATPDLIRG